VADALADCYPTPRVRVRSSRLRALAAGMMLRAARSLARWHLGRRPAGLLGRLSQWITRSANLAAPTFGGPAASLLRAGRLGRAVWAQVLEVKPKDLNPERRLPAREVVAEPFLLLVRSLRPQQAVALTCRPLVPRSRIAVTRRHPGGRTALLYVVQESRHVGDGVFRVMLVLTSRLYRSVG